MQKSLSIVIPVFNEEHYLTSCLNAIAAQTVKPDEVIVVDNNSTDQSANIARSFSFVKVVSESKQGIVFARNHGFDTASSDIIARIDADTLLPPSWVGQVKTYYDNQEHQSTAITGSCYFYNLHSGRLTAYAYDLIVFRINKIFLGHYFPWGSNSAFPRTFWRKVRLQVLERTDIHEDLDLGIHLVRARGDIVYLPKLRVGAVARRIVSDRGDLWQYLAMWPRTLLANGTRRDVLIWPFVVMVWLGSYWILVIEHVAGIFIRTTKDRN